MIDARPRDFKRITLGIAAALAASCAIAAPVTYQIDPRHTYPSFVADHAGGLSKWRGKFNRTSGTVVLDKEGQSGNVEITVDITSIDFGNDKMNEHARAPDMFDAPKFATATYTGKLAKFEDGKPTAVEGTLTLHGVTRPLNLRIHTFKCAQHPVNKKEVCGADASGTLNREDFGISYGKNRGFDMSVELQIQVEAQVSDGAKNT